MAASYLDYFIHAANILLSPRQSGEGWIALTGMLRDGVITQERALQIARGVMHDNAARLYGLPLLAGA